jgi:hypothetical protein
MGERLDDDSCPRSSSVARDIDHRRVVSRFSAFHRPIPARMVNGKPSSCAALGVGSARQRVDEGLEVDGIVAAVMRE